MSIEDAVFEGFASVYPHEAYAVDADKFWKVFHEKYPTVSKDDMVQLLDDTN